MRKSKSRISLLLIAILLGSLVTWAPPVSASGNSSPSPHLQAQGITALFDSETESTTVYWSNLVTTDYPLMLQMQESDIWSTATNAPLNESSSYLLPGQPSMCPSTDVGTCSGPSSTRILCQQVPMGPTTMRLSLISRTTTMRMEPPLFVHHQRWTYSPVSVGNFVYDEGRRSSEMTNDITLCCSSKFHSDHWSLVKVQQTSNNPNTIVFIVCRRLRQCV